MAFLIGDTIRLKATIKNMDDDEEAPASITITIYREDGTTKLLADEDGVLTAGTTAQYYYDWAISGLSYAVAFDAGDETNPIEAGDTLAGDHATPGKAVCIAIDYATATTGTITYVGTTHQFIDDEVITGGGNTVTVDGTPAESTDYLTLPETLLARWDWTGPHIKTIKFEVKPAV
jgi:hypothetical protein